MNSFLPFFYFLFASIGLFASSTAFAIPTRILVYEGDGTNESIVQSTINGLQAALLENTYTIERVTAETLIRTPLNPEEIALIFIPGGIGSSVFAAAITEAGLRNIVTYVQNGGRFGGACAGGALMAQRIIYELAGQIITTTHPDGTFLFPGTAYGPALAAYDPNHTNNSARSAVCEWVPENETALDPELINALLQPINLYWNGGCVFGLNPDQAPSCRASFTYNTNALYPPTADQLAEAGIDVNQPPAIILGQHGDGHYALFGPHPELMPTIFQSIKTGFQLPFSMQAAWNYINIFSNYAPNQAALVLTFCLHRLGLRVRDWGQFLPSNLPF
jgi:glutamine amidotransferase-like uncharacterized protein